MRTIYCVTTGEIVNSYKDYLKTNHWKNIRSIIRKKYKNKCRSCKTTENLEVHHKTYKNIGNEKLSNLTLLCRNCHQKAHDQSDNNDKALKLIRKKREYAFNYIKDKYGFNNNIEDFRFFTKRKNNIIRINENNYVKLSKNLSIFTIYNNDKEIIEELKYKKKFKDLSV